MKRVGFVGKALRMQLAQSPALTWLGLVGLALGAVCAGAAVARGAEAEKKVVLPTVRPGRLGHLSISEQFVEDSPAVC